ncbi:uncharacterized protein LOC110933630 [Helianthus annuus]|uniref:uncharacterized protein LOC110933630 n=1 Tax=Helianthus annuus TaxID=4232 RepID=UPI000B901BD4|nr:uncharacterized protein LOC110933630 [Helianthus annuus]
MILAAKVLPNRDDCSKWKTSKDGGFTVKEVRKTISSELDLNVALDNFWRNKAVTPEVNMFFWKAKDGKIPSARALEKRGIRGLNTTCSMCGSGVDDSKHILVKCQATNEVWKQILWWLKLPLSQQIYTVKYLLQTVGELGLSKKRADVIHAVFSQTMRSLWNARNRKVFEGKRMCTYKVVEEIKENSFEWITN